MKLIFLGAGSAFTLEPNNYQSNMIIEADNGKRLLIDCGTDIRFSLRDQGIELDTIDAVYVSHQHADHVGGMEYLMFSTYFNPTLKRPTLFVNENLAPDLWTHTLSGGAGSIQTKITSLDDYFVVEAIEKNGSFLWEGVSFTLVQVVHYMDGFDIVPSYGLMFTVNEVSYFITTDTQFNPNQIRDFYNMSDIIFQDSETSPFPSGVHAHYNELVTLDEETKAKMWLYHYQPGDKADCIQDGFRGWVVKGQTFEL
jgi:ribonuclease BN (tRNA processing enzyme)